MHSPELAQFYYDTKDELPNLSKNSLYIYIKYRKYHFLYESHERFSVGEFYFIFGVPKPSPSCLKKVEDAQK